MIADLGVLPAGIAVIALVHPPVVERCSSGFASHWRTHDLGQVKRLVVRVASVVHAVEMWLPVVLASSAG